MRKTRSAPAPFPTVAPHELLAGITEGLAKDPPLALDGRPQIVQFDAEEDRWLVRGLASDQSLKLVASRHRFLTHPDIISTMAAPVPHPSKPHGDVDGSLYEIVRKLPGQPWMRNGRLILDGHALHRPLPAPPGRLSLLTQQVARLHRASEGVDASFLPRISIRDHIRNERQRWQIVRDQIDASGVREVHIGRWASASQRVVFAAWDVMESAGFLAEMPLVANHGNIWPAHVIDNNGAIGLVDWGATHFGSPLVDVAQVVARIDGWGSATLEEVIESYMSERSLSADERRLLPVFGALDLAVETGYVLAEAYVADIDQTSQYAEYARTGAGQMLSALESIGWSIRKANLDSKALRREARDNARAAREPGQKPRPKKLTSKRPKQ